MTHPTKEPRAADNRDYPARIWVERDAETNEKRWFTIGGMGVEYVCATQLPVLPDDVTRLVIAARDVAYSDPMPETMRELDKAAEAFAERVPWDDEPDDIASPSAPVHASGGVEAVLTIDALAQEIRRVDGKHSLGAGALAEAILPFIARAIASLSPAPTSGAEAGGAANEATQITMGRGLVDVTRIEHEGRSGILFRPRSEHIPIGDEGELQPGKYWPVASDVVIWIENEAGAQVVQKYLSTFLAKPASEPAGGDVAETFQQRVQPWMMACFGAEISADITERNHRFLEEALELVQSTGCTAGEAHQLVDYVFGRPAGEPPQESGGVQVTHAALCLAAGMDMHANGETELARIWTKVEQIRAKQAAKLKHSPLPQHVVGSGRNRADATPNSPTPGSEP